MAREDPEFILGTKHKAGISSGLFGGRQEGENKAGCLSPGSALGLFHTGNLYPPVGMSPARPLGAERSYLPAQLSLGTRRSSGSFVPGVAPQPGDARRSPGTRCALRCTQTGALVTPQPHWEQGPSSRPPEGLQLHRVMALIVCSANPPRVYSAS